MFSFTRERCMNRRQKQIRGSIGRRDDRATRLDASDQLCLFLRNTLKRTKALQMFASQTRQHHNVRLHRARKRLKFAGRIRTNFANHKLIILTSRKDREGHADGVVEALLRTAASKRL